jgi:molecular chaperone DnaK
MGSMVEPLETRMNRQSSRQHPADQTMTPGTMINGTVGTPDYVETSPVYGLEEDGEFDFDADETISSDYEAVD